MSSQLVDKNMIEVGNATLRFDGMDNENHLQVPIKGKLFSKVSPPKQDI
jgi:hypothetical protein